MARICKHCFLRIEYNNGTTSVWCPSCKLDIDYVNDTISEHQYNARMAQLKAMHELMCNANNELIYMSWITTGVPDCPSEDDFQYIATDDDSYNECFDLFVRLIRKEDNRW